MATEELTPEEERGDVLETETAPEEETTEEESTEEVDESADDLEVEGDEETEEGETEEETEEDDEPEEEEHMLPKSRYDTVQKRNRALQEKVSRMETEREEMLAARRDTPAQEDTGQDDRLANLDDKINDALLDGDKDQAKKYRAEQRDIEREIFQVELQESTQSATIQAREQVRLDAAIDFLEVTYDELDVNSETFDQGMVDEMESLRHAFVASGAYSPSQALIKAAKYIFPDVEMVPESPSEKRTPKRKAAIKKAVAASSKQPPDISGVGDDADVCLLYTSPSPRDS